MGAIDKMRRREPLLDRGDIVPRVRRYHYGQDEDGGDVAGYDLKDGEGVASSIPKGSVITKVSTIITEAFASGGAATIALGYTGSAAAFKAATAYNDASFTGNDVHLSPAAAPVGPLAADVVPTLTIAGAALTDGKGYVDIEYVPPRDY